MRYETAPCTGSLSGNRMKYHRAKLIPGFNKESGTPMATTDDDLGARLRRIPVSLVHDILRSGGHGESVLPHDIRPLAGSAPLAGPIFTIEGGMHPGLSVDESLHAWARLLSRIPSGVVAVCQPNTRSIALMGELSAQALQIKGVLGYLADGACRDIAMVEAAGFPVWCTHATPSDIAARWKATSTGEPIGIGAVTIRTGDWFTGDRDGALILPMEIAAEAVREAEAMAGTEGDMRREILAGVDPEEAYLRYRKF